MRLLVLAVAVLACGTRAASAQSELEDRVRNLESKMSDRENGASHSEATGNRSVIDAWFDDGLRLNSRDGAFEGRIGAFLILHSVAYVKENERDSVDTFRIRDAGIEVSARLWGAWSVFLAPQILPDGVNLYYGWAEFNKWEALKIRAGLFKQPYSREELEHRKWGDMLELSLSDPLIPGRDQGAMVFGVIADGLLSYWAGVFNGNGDDVASDENSDKDVCARVELNPGAAIESDILKHLYVAGSIIHGRERRDPNEPPIELAVQSTETEFLSAPAAAVGDFRVDGELTGLEGDVAWNFWKLELKSEYHYYRQEMEFDDRKDTFNAYSFNASVGFWIGGSRVPGQRPEIEKPLFSGGFGGLQFVARYSQLYVGSELQDHAGYVGTNRVREYAGCVNWYPNAHVRVSAMYANVEYGSERVTLSGGTTVDDENVWIFRAQVDF
ncbi:MAG: hypothetical protein HYY18_20635 [Planctomycetes bacterium]|nr:hypothetical protein [Planctomycetota bacterium]